jgi:hypothetical protein
MIPERLKDWMFENSGVLPTNIVYYRDGVSVGQYDAVRDVKVKAIRKAYN